MRYLICGDRNWLNKSLIEALIQELPRDSIIIEGEARGADSMAREIAESMNLKVEKYPADWNLYHKVAGFIRNMQMLKEGKPDVIWALHNDIVNSRGTKNMVEIAVKGGIPTYVYSEKSHGFLVRKIDRIQDGRRKYFVGLDSEGNEICRWC